MLRVRTNPWLSVMTSALLLAATVCIVAAQNPIKSLGPGQVFGLVALQPQVPSVHEQVITVNVDGTLGINDPEGGASADFHGVLFPDYGIVLHPDPLTALKLSEQNVLHLNSTLWAVETGFSASGSHLLPRDSSLVGICPSWNNVLVLDDGSKTLCKDIVHVELELVTSYTL